MERLTASKGKFLKIGVTQANTKCIRINNTIAAAVELLLRRVQLRRRLERVCDGGFRAAHQPQVRFQGAQPGEQVLLRGGGGG